MRWAGGWVAVGVLAIVLTGVVIAETQSSDSGGSIPDAGSGGQSAPAPPAPLEHCVTYDRNSAVVVEFAANDNPCARWVRDEGAAGDFWSVAEAGFDHGPKVCEMQRPESRARVIVYDAGGQLNGQAICAHFAALGWTEVVG